MQLIIKRQTRSGDRKWSIRHAWKIDRHRVTWDTVMSKDIPVTWQFNWKWRGYRSQQVDSFLVSTLVRIGMLRADNCGGPLVYFPSPLFHWQLIWKGLDGILAAHDLLIMHASQNSRSRPLLKAPAGQGRLAFETADFRVRCPDTL